MHPFIINVHVGAGAAGPAGEVATLRPVRPSRRGVATGLTLAFDLAALRRVTDPAGTVADARRWSEHVGVVTDRPPYVLTKFTREHAIENDFPPEPAPAAETLEHMRTHHDTERYVFVVPDDAPPTAEGWERLPLSEAAERADWELGDPPASESDAPAVEDDSDWP